MRNNIIKSILTSLVVTPLAILPVVSCAKNDANYIKVTFDAGEGKIVKGEATVKLPKDSKTTFGSILKPTVEAQDKIFVGWTLNGLDFNDSEIVSSSITLKANYVSSTSGYYCIVEFAPAVAGVKISGNTLVAVKRGHPFFTVNKPIATKDNARFKFWSTRSGEEFTEDMPINANVVLTPTFVDQSTITFGQPTATTVTYHGPTTVKIDSDAAFSTIGRPDPTATQYAFTGQWYYDADCTSGQEVGESDTFTEDKIIYPKMVQIP